MKLPAVYRNLTPRMRADVRKEYVRRQGGKCQFCGEPLSGPPSQDVVLAEINEDLFPDGFFNHPVHLHHNHETGLTIGAVHCRCNAVSFQYHGI